MDKLNKLQALTGDLNVVGEESAFQATTYVKPQHLYEGTDSEDDEYIVSERRNPASSRVNSNLDPGVNQSGSSVKGLYNNEADFRCRSRHELTRIPRVSI